MARKQFLIVTTNLQSGTSLTQIQYMDEMAPEMYQTVKHLKNKTTSTFIGSIIAFTVTRIK